MNSFYISKPFLFAPGLESKDDFLLWANDKKEILNEKSSPALKYTDPLFRRRLSQISKMTIEVVHNLIEETKIDKDTKLVFVSFRGELEREFKLNKSLAEEQLILPAGFSISVFNAPIALTSIACNLKAGYNAIYPSYDNFYNGFVSAIAPILSGRQEKIIFVYADEMILEEYSTFAPNNKPPLAFSCILSHSKLESVDSVEYSLLQINENVYDFIKGHINKCWSK